MPPTSLTYATQVDLEITMDDESDFSILVSRQETRFQHQENSNSKEVTTSDTLPLGLGMCL